MSGLSFSAARMTVSRSATQESGIGPFNIQKGTMLSYGKLLYSKQGFHVQAFVNALDGKAPAAAAGGKAPAVAAATLTHRGTIRSPFAVDPAVCGMWAVGTGSPLAIIASISTCISSFMPRRRIVMLFSLLESV